MKAAVFLNERIPRNAAPSVVIACLGSALLSVKSPTHLTLCGISVRGILGVFLAATGWAVCTGIGRAIMRDGQYRSSNMTIIRLGAAALLQLPFVLTSEQAQTVVSLGPLEWSILSGCAVFGTAGGYLFYMRRLATVSSPVAGLLEVVTPPTAAMLGVVYPWRGGDRVSAGGRSDDD